MFGDNIDNLLPNDDELVRRENVFLGLFDKYSIDEGDDAVLADMEDETVEADDNGSGSSFSEASSIEGDNDDIGDNEANDEISKQLEPVIQERVNAWPKKGINLQLKMVDPSVSVSEWLKANQESTTTTKNYKKTVVAEVNETVTTTMKKTKIVTKKTSFNAYVPRLMAIKETQDQQQHKPIVPEITEKRNDNTGQHHTNHTMDLSKTESKGHRTKNGRKVNKLPVAIELSKLAKLPIIDESAIFTNPEQSSDRLYQLPKNKEKLAKLADASTIDRSQTKSDKPRRLTRKQQQLQENAKTSATSSIIDEPQTKSDKPKRPTKRQVEQSAKFADASTVDEPQTKPDKPKKQRQRRENKEQPSQSESTKKITHTAVTPPESTHRRCLRSRFKENIVPQVQSQVPLGKPLKATQKKSKKQDSQIELPTNDLQSSTDVRCEVTNKTVHRSRSPLKERDVNRSEPKSKLRDVRVRVKRIPCPKVSTRNSVRTQKQSLDIADNEMNVNAVSSCDPTTTTCSSHVELRKSTAPRVSRLTMTHKLPPLREITIHSPNSETLIGSKINDTTMVVTKRQYGR